MNSYKQKIIHSFDNAVSYEQSAHMQKIVVKRLVNFIKTMDIDFSQPISILEIGCGTGLLTQYLTELFPKAQFLITDISVRMIERVKEKYNNNPNIEFKVMDGEAIDLEHSFDLIVSSLAFQWFENLEQSLQSITALLNPNGYLVCSTLAQKSFEEWRQLYTQNHCHYSFQSYPDVKTLESYWPSKVGGGFWQAETIIESVENGIDFIKGLRNIGAHTSSNMHKPLSAGQLRKIIAQFDLNYGYTTYEVALGSFRRYAAKGFFVTGTDTDVGKTFVSACLTKALNATYWKPMQTGLKSDFGDSKTVQILAQTCDNQIIPPLVALQEPLSPEAAAKLEEIRLDINKLDFFLATQNRPYIVEGAGGVLVPIADSQYMIQMMQKVNLPVVIVARTELGTLNHTLLTIEVLRNHHIPIAGVILNGNQNLANKEAIERHGNIKMIAEVPRMDQITDQFIAQFKQEIRLFY
ncbi:Dethiobiotin synthetase (BioD) (PDB:1DTS) [Commensalibacter communis]|uniref:ATP-dependent dethiobiotin synthetase BioD n=1 Tax=Commensalibacter communis TaxID=2972786 RepID=A0A9W4TN56_9PROT|nr:dethiobiotin synthase [Commensalibacter communis]CAI3926724.1 Dethiobiotin synthetase (BioD) (PDB:1DTS) [Commensalibacter communis]CAI3927336.1 Dethiobiotin synthetase (BioD) (PDB:1DTS) [Commensalibacter communis]CAI3934116.1 Dethiobiotin synthetase (BioD) (PDB:1DTS) [Commensalibacter communis]CAI3935697.1 Dethiobiotin synthetase (BioD) (PDB:1DTS) [Commensalibacter communis]